ncbi:MULTISPECIES: aldo/keto reductase [unclassified Curtobacterium]|uniref:aldo/keto reductase n=1 Tax=unclassified Curtobacterium TaxID=257496 RepID=UPI0008DE7957|nr:MULTISPECIES: aldo/keto reductase [unclassified Curtobacterium]OIH94164.1 oxidoreductase [Curtobacterium sp. MCBA15_003]OII29340.1 oxidoreductase [Curtobacterium sp. MMLR14_006]
MVTSIPLRDGASIPAIGFGVYKVDDTEAESAVGTALDAGYRHVDTAEMYGNETGVGKAIRASSLDRDDVFVTTKVWNDHQGRDATLQAFDDSVARLGLDTVDLYLIHWPAAARDRYVETWRTLVELRESGRARSVGVSNFQVEHLQRLVDETGEVPALNQVEHHPWLPQRELIAFHQQHGIATGAWSPLGRGRLIDEPVLTGIADAHGVSVAQVLVRWNVQQGVVVLPKSVTPSRIRSNLDVDGFVLTDEELAAIATLESGQRTGSHPDAVS